MAESLERSLISVLECPMCDNYMSPPIRQCQKGHTFCQECFQKLDSCSICRSQKDPSARCVILETIHSKLIVPCKNAIFGCEFACRGVNILKHQESCQFRRRTCPLRNYDNCPWRSTNSKMEAHLRAKHATSFYTNRWQMLLAYDFRKINYNHYIYAIILAFNEFFRITWDVDEITGRYKIIYYYYMSLNPPFACCAGMTRWAVYFLGPVDKARNFSYKLRFALPEQRADDSLGPIVFRSPCSAAPQDDQMKFVEHKYFFIHRAVLEKYCKYGDDLHYGVSVYTDNSTNY